MNRPRLFEDKDLFDLLEMSQKSNVLSTCAREVFQRKFGTKTFAPLSMDMISIHETAEIIEEMNVVSTLFEVFGKYIQKLHLEYNVLQNNDRKEIHKLIGMHCGDSLKSLTLVRWDTNILQSLNEFRKLENLTLTGNVKVSRWWFSLNFLYTKKTMNEIFPVLRRLNLDYVAETDTIFDVKFPQLEEVQISPSTSDDDHYTNTKVVLESLFSKNAQILNLIYVHCNSLEMLQLAKDFLPNLDTLQINVFRLKDESTGEKIHFTNVKKAYLWWDDTKLSELLAFDELDSLYMTCLADECVNFVEQNKNVRKIFIAGDSLKNEHILEIGEEIKNLDELFIATTAEIDTHTITEYYKINEELRAFRLEIIDSLFLNSKMEKWRMEREMVEHDLD